MCPSDNEILYNQNNLADKQYALWLQGMPEPNQIMDESTQQLELAERTQFHSLDSNPVISKIEIQIDAYKQATLSLVLISLGIVLKKE